MRHSTMFSKRRFLKFTLLGIGGTLAAAAGLGAYITQTNQYRTRYGTLLRLDGHLADIAHTLAQASVPTGRLGFPTIEEAEVVNRLDEELFFVNEKIYNDFKAALYLLEMLPMSYLHASRFSRLSLNERKKFLTEAIHTKDDTVRAVIANLSATMRWYYYGHPSTWKVIGYDGPFMNLPEQKSEQRLLYTKLTQEPNPKKEA
jgi:hypothetical protein